MKNIILAEAANTHSIVKQKQQSSSNFFIILFWREINSAQSAELYLNISNKKTTVLNSNLFISILYNFILPVLLQK